ncbi:chemotaxis protein CheW [Candidatus Galacturonibacter soehngenii]|uniref:Purine-binding chemotaxis protein CheW n=1 Tax=Candidatus Galacturonatibacter soehngenii TaxID=2307010 RepID=A0A7V7QK14_9FIRM|nr:chemotaxis protein CheW [Candidatus Galacturonibacter soehngenii]KAB1437686.1 purine-binding chemotaxis protein CheW [Candidatus Galacturonibacter soehngenii]MBA4686915.1 purine-binding chemotaxis protein CheW [Candidatus Galacturonibacter soehngenii]
MEENKVEYNQVQYIVVKIGNEQYGIDISYVDNIVRMQKIIRVPKAQHYFKGVINLRGVIVPVMSIRLKMQLEDDKFTNSSRIIILKMDQALIGIIVDEVKEVVTLENTDIEKMAYDSKEDRTSYINGIGKHAGELISLLDINSVITEKELV